jgi:hypothetical protein
MTFRGFVRDGKIVIDTHGELPDGTPVEALPLSPKRKPKGKAKPRGGKAAKAARKTRKAKAAAGSKRRLGAAKARRGARREESITTSPFFGIWKDRPEWKGMTAVEIAAELRRKAMGRHAGP